MSVMISVFIFVFGATVGSFLNVAILRYGTNVSVVSSRSRCMNCSKQLKWYELIPIFSFFAQSGKCRNCLSKISWQYPVVEIITGILFLLIFNFQFSIFNEFSSSLFFDVVYLWFVVSVLTIIFVYDLRHFIIPDKMVYLFVFVTLIRLLFIEKTGFEILSGVTSGIIFFSFFAIIWLVSKGKWMGLGDAKLALGLGWFLGPVGSIFAFLFSFWLGAIVSVFLVLSNRKKYTTKSIVPFAPFLIIGSALSYIFSASIFAYLIL